MLTLAQVVGVEHRGERKKKLGQALFKGILPYVQPPYLVELITKTYSDNTNFCL